MKRIVYTLATVLLALTSCQDFNEIHFEGLEDQTVLTNKISLEYTFTDADYAAMSAYKIDGYELTGLKNAKAFSEAVPAAKVIPMYLSKTYYSATQGSAALMTYNFNAGKPGYLADFAATKAYKLSNEEYYSVWGGEEVAYLTPAQSPATHLPTFLATAYPEAAANDYVRVAYKYSTTEPIIGVVGGGDEEEAFEPFIATFDTEASSNTVISEACEGWTSTIVAGEKFWLSKSYSGNFYMQASAYGSEGDAEMWAISPAINLTGAVTPLLSFDVCFGYVAGDVLSVLVSNNYTDNVANATWVDVTDSFDLSVGLPAENANYGVLTNTGRANLSQFAGETIVVAFKYSGNATVTTTAQVDNVSVIDGGEMFMGYTEPFDTEEAANTVCSDAFEGWTSTIVAGEKFWLSKSYSGNTYMQASAYGSEGDAEMWAISPAINLSAAQAPAMSFDVCFGYVVGDVLSVLVSDNYTGNVATATWTDLTSSFDLTVGLPAEDANYGVLTNVGQVDISSFAGKTIVVAFKYVGNATLTTTAQVDNLSIVEAASAAPATVVNPGVVAENKADLYQFNGEAWTLVNTVLALSADDYDAMGTDANQPGKYNNFSSSIDPYYYIPRYLNNVKGYAVEGDVQTVMYDYYTDSNAIRVDEFVYNGETWAVNDGMSEVQEQYLFSEGAWNPDPTVVFNVVKGDGSYQIIADWVYNNIDVPAGNSTKGDGTYISSYGNNEWYFGSSEHYGNYDFRPSKYTTENLPETDTRYLNKSEAEITAALWANLGESLEIMCAGKWPNAVPQVNGVDVYYKIGYAVYDGAATISYVATLQCTGVGEFTFISDGR